MDTRKGTRVAVTTVSICLFVLAFTATTGCDGLEAADGQLGAIRGLPILADIPGAAGCSLLSMDVEAVEDEEFELGSPLE